MQADAAAPSSDEVPTVVVIGAGAAGLAAARALTQAGARVTVLEGRSRIGGRMDTRTFADGSSVDLGAAWVFGVGPENPLTPPELRAPELFLKTDWDNALAWEAVGSAAAAAPSPRLSAEDEAAIEAWMRLTSGMVKERQSKARAATLAAMAGRGAPPADESLWDAVCALQSKRFPGVAALDERQRLLLRWAWAAESEHDYAAPMERLSLPWWDADDAQSDDMFLWRDGFRSWASHVAAGVPHIRLDCRVELIAVRPSGWAEEGDAQPQMEGEATVTTEGEAAAGEAMEGEAAAGGATAGGATADGATAAASGGGGPRGRRVEVRLVGGEAVQADACVVTLPLGVLQSGRVAFEPSLPADKRAAIGRLGMGVLNKVALRFEHCFWAAAGGAAGGASSEAHVLSRVPTSPGRSAPEACEAPMWVNLRPLTGANVLVGYFSGEAAVRVEAMDDAALQVLGLSHADCPLSLHADGPPHCMQIAPLMAR